MVEIDIESVEKENLNVFSVLAILQVYSIEPSLSFLCLPLTLQSLRVADRKVWQILSVATYRRLLDKDIKAS